MVHKYAAAILAATILAFSAVAGSSALPAEAQTQNLTAVKGCTGTTVYLNTAEYREFRLHNRIRVEHGLGRLCIHPALERAARAHSREMIEKNYFSHNSYDGTPFYKRISYFHYRYHFVGENIAWGSGESGDPGEIFDFWMHSPEHRANILDKDYQEVGIGVANGTFEDIQGVKMWTADFGRRN